MVFDMDEAMEMVMEDTMAEEMPVFAPASHSAGGFSTGQKIAIRKTFPEAWIWHDYSNERLVQLIVALCSCLVVWRSIVCRGVGCMIQVVHTYQQSTAIAKLKS